MLLLVTIIAMGLVVWHSNAELVQWRNEVQKLRNEVQKLREETGQLTITDPEKIHAIQMVTDYPLAWKWRVYIPAGRKVHIAHKTHRISKEELPKANGGPSLVGPKEFVVTVNLDRQPDGTWRSAISCNNVTVREVIPEDATTWLTKGESGSWSEQVRRAASVEQTGEPLVLLRRRVFYGRVGQVPPVNEPAFTDGLLIWLAE